MNQSISSLTASKIMGLHKQLNTLAQARQKAAIQTGVSQAELCVGVVDAITVIVPNVLVQTILFKVEQELFRQLIEANDQARKELSEGKDESYEMPQM